jgi:hypothetical protein
MFIVLNTEVHLSYRDWPFLRLGLWMGRRILLHFTLVPKSMKGTLLLCPNFALLVLCFLYSFYNILLEFETNTSL